MADILQHLGQPGARPRREGTKILGRIDAQLGWLNSPTGKILPTSIGRYRGVLSSKQLNDLEKMRFDFPELELSVSMERMLNRFSIKEELPPEGPTDHRLGHRQRSTWRWRTR
jgi:hypothetical protein